MFHPLPTRPVFGPRRSSQLTAYQELQPLPPTEGDHLPAPREMSAPEPRTEVDPQASPTDAQNEFVHGPGVKFMPSKG